MEVKTEGKRDEKMKGKRKYKRKDAWQDMIKGKMEEKMDGSVCERMDLWMDVAAQGTQPWLKFILMDVRKLELYSLVHQQIHLDSAVFLAEMSHPMLLSLPHLQGLMASGST